MTNSCGGLKWVVMVLIATLWLAMPAPADAGGNVGRVVPNVNPPIVKAGRLLQEAEAAEEGEANAEDAYAEESSESDVSEDSGESEESEDSDDAEDYSEETEEADEE